MERSRHKKGSPGEGGRGAVIVEVALVLPILTILLLGIIDLGLIIREHQLIQNAAREGARFSALEENRMDTNGDPVERARAIRNRVMAYLNLDFPDVTAAADPTTITANEKYSFDLSIGGTVVGTLVMDQDFVVVVVPDSDPGDSVDDAVKERASEVTVTYNRRLLFPGAPFLPSGFDPVSLTGRSVIGTLY